MKAAWRRPSVEIGPGGPPMTDPSRYATAGVSLGRAERATARIRELVSATFTEPVLGEFGGFAGGFDLSRHPDPGQVLVASTDGVGTKVLVAIRAGRHDTVGEDLVNHCVNDILTQGAAPLFFLDYIGCGRLDADRIAEIVSGVARGCRENGCALLGGETAEMPDLYREEEYDLAGSIVGLVERDRRIDGAAIRPGDLVLGLASSGLHTNGYTLARKIVFDDLGLDAADELPGTSATVADALLAVHRSYLRPVRPLLASSLIRGMAHVTGGGFEGNVSRMLPEDVDCEIDAGAWEPPALFRSLSQAGRVEPAEMYRVFNMGIGFLLFVNPGSAEAVGRVLASHGEEGRVVGRALRGSGRVRVLLGPRA